MTKVNDAKASRYNKISIIVLIILIIIRVFGWYLFEYTQRIEPTGEIINSAVSQNSNYVAKAYVNDSGATMDHAILVRVFDKEQNTKNVYWEYPCEHVEMKWMTPYEIKINGVLLDVRYDVYDWRKNNNHSIIVTLIFGGVFVGITIALKVIRNKRARE